MPQGAVSATVEHGAGGDAILHVSSIPALGDSLSGAEAVAVTEEAGEGETRPSKALVLTAPLQ